MSMHGAAPAIPDRPSLLVLDRLVAGYDRPVVGPISFDIAPGEIVALCGPNGAGKTTLLNVVGGGARVFGGALQKPATVRVAHQHQSALPLQDVPLCGRELLALTHADAEALPDVMKPLLRRRLSDLSGGQLQFLQVWACLTAPVDLVLLDEPTNNVDQSGIGRMEEAIRRVRRDLAVLLVSHDRRFIEALDARIVEVGPP
jgi:ATPase subunit of ABC transporter with duplicated ATPase domains